MNTNMHATIEQLLEIKDGHQNGASLHLTGCERCQAELAALEMLNDGLFEAADAVPRPEVWDRIEQSAAANQTDSLTPTVPAELLAAQAQAYGNAGVVAANQQRSISHAIYTLAASILVTGFIGLYMFSQNINSQTQNELLQANIQQLMINSRGMEQALQQVSLQSELLSAAERSETDRLYWQLAYLDQKIHDSSSELESNPQRLEVLWNNRIQALRELNQIYYQRQQELDDSEL